jgi:hypothetical protein
MRAEIKADIADVKVEVIKWAVGAIFTAAGLVLAIVKIL